MFSGSVDEYRAWAAQCLAMAARAKREEDKRAWLELAEKWRRLAEQTNGNNDVPQLAQQPAAKAARKDPE